GAYRAARVVGGRKKISYLPSARLPSPVFALRRRRSGCCDRDVADANRPVHSAYPHTLQFGATPQGVEAFGAEPRALASGIRIQFFSFMFKIGPMPLLVQGGDAACALVPLAVL